MGAKYYIILIIMSIVSKVSAQDSQQIDYIKMSQDFLYAVRTDENAAPYLDSLATASEDLVAQQLVTDIDKKAFFINLYNAYTQYILKQDPNKYKDRNEFFKSNQILFASHKVSLDKIEHGFLRHSRVKWSLGYFGKIFPGKLEKKFRVKKVDYRIHFTLNCGASSCPSIAYYKPEGLDEQLDMATLAYLKGEAENLEKENTLYLPMLMNWFRGDFGGKKNEIKLCKKLGILPQDAKQKIAFKSYDWQLYLENYKDN